jgi:tRNA (guanine-N7-)-methyltransferase
MRAADQGLDNLKLMRHDAVRVLKEHLRPGTLSGIRIFFPDPWHKTKHHKRRLVQSPFLVLCVQALAKNGLLHLATDWQPYAEQMLRLLEKTEGLANTQATGCYSPRPEWRPLTRFEARSQRLGHDVWDLIFQRI